MRSKPRTPEGRAETSTPNPQKLAEQAEIVLDALLPADLDESSRPLITRFFRIAAIVAESKQSLPETTTREGLMATAAEAAGFAGVAPTFSLENGGINSALALAQENSELARFQSALLAHLRSRGVLDRAFSLLCAGD